MNGCRKRFALNRRLLGIALLATSIAWHAATRGASCQAGEPGLLPALEKPETAEGPLSDGPLLKAAEANTPARLDEEATSASQPISPRPLMCCRPAPQAARGARGAEPVHPTLAALAEAVRPRRGATHLPPPEAAPQSPAPEMGLEPAAAPLGETSPPEPLRNDELALPGAIEPTSNMGPPPRVKPFTPDESAAQLGPPPAESRREIVPKVPPLTIANPWAARAPAATFSPPVDESADEPADEMNDEPVDDSVDNRFVKPESESPEEPVVETTREQTVKPANAPPVWRSTDARSVHLTRYHRPETPPPAGVSQAPAAPRSAPPPASISLTPAANRSASPPPAAAEISIDKNPLRTGRARSTPAGGVWSSSNPLR